jgi:hypothetical protein
MPRREGEVFFFGTAISANPKRRRRRELGVSPMAGGSRLANQGGRRKAAGFIERSPLGADFLGQIQPVAITLQ